MPLAWKTPNPGLGPTLGYDTDGMLISRVRRIRNGWHGWYDPAGLDRLPQAPFGQPDDLAPVGSWSSPGEALTAMNRYHDRHGPQSRS